MTELNERQKVLILEYYSNLNYTISCYNKPNIGGKSKKHKKQKSGTQSKLIQDILKALCLSPSAKVIPTSDIPTSDIPTNILDLPKEILWMILDKAKNESENEIKFMKTVPQISKAFTDAVLENESNFTDIEMWITHVQIINIYSKFIEHVVNNCRVIIMNTLQYGSFEICLTTKQEYNNQTYNIVYKKISFQKAVSGKVSIMITSLCEKDNIEYNTNNNIYLRTLNADEDAELIRIILFNINTNTNIKLYQPKYTNIINVDIKRSIYEQVYTKLSKFDIIFIRFYIKIQDIMKLADNDYYIKLPSNYEGLGKATFIYLPRIYKELKIDKYTFLGKTLEDREFNILFSKYNQLYSKEKEPEKYQNYQNQKQKQKKFINQVIGEINLE